MIKILYTCALNVIHFLWWWALALLPRINEEATSPLWLTSHGAPLGCRLSTVCSAGKRFAEPGASKRHNIVMARWIGDDPRVISHSDPSSGDSIEPVRSQVSKHPPGMVDVYCEYLPPPVADGPAKVAFEDVSCLYGFECFAHIGNLPMCVLSIHRGLNVPSRRV